jgi:Arc/MetJ-type ribon-helix-helix transcriptional regulator
MVRPAERRRDFATRLPPETLAQLDALVRQGRFKTRTAAIEAAVERLFAAEQRDPERLRRAFERAAGALDLGVDRAAARAARLDRLAWESAGRPGARRAGS